MSKKRKSRQRNIIERKNKQTKKIKENELANLKRRVQEINANIAKAKVDNFKEFNIRNLKVFGHTCNVLVPYVICAGLTVGTFALCDGGLPFKTDEITRHKEYNLEYQSGGYVYMEDHYKNTHWFTGSTSESSNLVVYSPWEKDGDNYTRFRRSYNLDSSDILNLYDAVLNEDYDYVANNLKDYDEEIQTRSDAPVDDDYFFEASLHMVNKDDTLTYDESKLKNAIITIVELIIGLGSGFLIAWNRDFEYFYELENTNEEYKRKLVAIKPLKEELKRTEAKILTLEKGRR